MAFSNCFGLNSTAYSFLQRLAEGFCGVLQIFANMMVFLAETNGGGHNIFAGRVSHNSVYG